MVIVTNKTRRLQAVYQRILFVELPVKRHRILVMVPPSVKPYCANLAVIGEQLGELSVHEIVISRPIDLCRVTSCVVTCASLRIILTRPVDVGVVEVEPYALTVALVGKLLQHIAPKRRGIDNVIRRLLRAPHRKSVVMTRCYTYIFGTGSLYGTHPGSSIKIGRIKSPCRLGILLGIHSVVEIPLSLCKHAVKSPMEKYPEPGILKLGLCFLYFGRRYIIGSKA